MPERCSGNGTTEQLPGEDGRRSEVGGQWSVVSCGKLGSFVTALMERIVTAGGAVVAQTSESAVSPTSQSAKRPLPQGRPSRVNDRQVETRSTRPTQSGRRRSLGKAASLERFGRSCPVTAMLAAGAPAGSQQHGDVKLDRSDLQRKIN